MISPRHCPATIDDFCNWAEAFASARYKSREPLNFRQAMKPLRELAGYETFGEQTINARLLFDCQVHLIQQGLCRSTVNDRIRRIVTALTWAAAPQREWIGYQVIERMAPLESVKEGRQVDIGVPVAPEGEGRLAVPWELVEATQRLAPPWLNVLIHAHRWSGCRPDEAVRLMRSELSEMDGCLVFTLGSFKTKHHNEKRRRSRRRQRHVVLGPRGRELVDPWLKVNAADKLFHVKTEQAYYQAVARLCERNAELKQMCLETIGQSNWYPAGIRYTRASELSMAHRKFDESLDRARIVAGHAHVETTLIYADFELPKLIEIQKTYG